ncbi:hypothetical protein F4779DRAFT_588821 [Xylariaceae sp. FL0662B]|nr:hypothetical protein F4779DRAFT_588821 [Xylariaceae sp. FL0662B]
MCEFLAMKSLFLCRCPTHRSRGYEYCPHRAKCIAHLRQFEWLTSCPERRKALKGKKKYDDRVSLHRCCAKVKMSQLDRLRLGCNSITREDTEHNL